MKPPRQNDVTATDPSDTVALANDEGNNVGLLVRYTFRSFTRMLQILVSPFGLTAAEFRVLRTLATGGALTQVQIASLAGMDRPYAALVVKQLRDKEMIDTCADPIDRRRVALSLSARGAAITDTIANELADVNRASVEGIPARHLAIFSEVSVRMRQNLDDLAAERGALD